MKRSTSIPLILVALLSLVAAGAALRRHRAIVSPTVQAPAGPADPWLERAQREIAAAQFETSTDLLLAQPGELSIMLYRLAPTNGHRALAAGLIDQTVKLEVDKKRGADYDARAYVGGAFEHARVDDDDGAHRMLTAIGNRSAVSDKRPDFEMNKIVEDVLEPPPGAATNPAAAAAKFEQDFVSTMGDSLNAMLLAETYLRLGDQAGFERTGIRGVWVTIIARDLREDGLDAQATWLTQWAQKQDAAAATQPADAKTSLDDRRMEAIKRMVDAGDLAAAASAAAGIEDHLPPRYDNVSWNGYLLSRAQMVVAKGCVDAGDLDGFRAARDAILAVARKSPHTRFSDDVEIDKLLDLCLRARDATSFVLVATLWKNQLQPEASKSPGDRLNYAWEMARLAAQYEAIGDHANYRAAVDRAETVLATVDAESDPEADYSISHHRAEVYLWIAAAHARAGDSTAVARNKAASFRAGTLDDTHWDDPWRQVVRGYADAGHFADAIAAISDIRYKKYNSLPQYISRRQAQAGQFDDAWQTLHSAAGSQLLGEYDLIVLQVQSGNLEGLAARIDARPSPNQRALDNLAVAAALLGRPYSGPFRVYKPRAE